MKYRLPTLSDLRAERALFPALCGALLGVMALGQLALTGVDADDMPEPAITGGGVRAAMPQIGGMRVPGNVGQSPIFTPDRTVALTGPDGTPVAQSPLDGAIVAGAVTVRRTGHAVLVLPDRRIIRLPLGARHAGWQLVGLRPDHALFIKGNTRMSVPYGSAPAPSAAPQEETEEDTE